MKQLYVFQRTTYDSVIDKNALVNFLIDQKLLSHNSSLPLLQQKRSTGDKTMLVFCLDHCSTIGDRIAGAVRPEENLLSLHQSSRTSVLDLTYRTQGHSLNND